MKSAFANRAIALFCCGVRTTVAQSENPPESTGGETAPIGFRNRFPRPRGLDESGFEPVDCL
jgi:hypothetical protein